MFMKKTVLIIFCIFTLIFASLCGCDTNKSSGELNSDLFSTVRTDEKNEETPINPDENEKPAPRRSCKRNKKRPPRREPSPDDKKPTE